MRQTVLYLGFLLLAHPAQADLAGARDHFENRRWEAARDLAEPLARAGNAEAELLLGDLYGIGGLLPRQERRAVEWWRRAAHKGHPLAQLRLARSYASGRGVGMDGFRAALWARLAATGRAPGAAELAAELAGRLSPEDRAALAHVLQDYGPYFYPLSK